jgi:hypothetical protein
MLLESCLDLATQGTFLSFDCRHSEIKLACYFFQLELVFPPAGGAKGVKVVASILTGRDEALPIALFVSDAPGRGHGSTTGVFALHQCKGPCGWRWETFTSLAGSEIEDLIPPDVLAQVVDRWQRGLNTALLTPTSLESLSFLKSRLGRSRTTSLWSHLFGR